MQIHDKVAQDLHGVLAKKFTKLTLADSQAVSTIEPTKGRIFTLEYGGSGKSYGNVTVNIVDPNSLVIYYNTNISEDMGYDDKKDWYSFLKELRYFAKRNLMNFDVRNIGKQQLDKTDYAYIKQNDNSYDQSEVKFESKLTGTLKTSYQTFGENVRLIIKHTTPVDEDKRGARTRHIHHLYVEDVEGERVRLPFKSLIAGRAVAQHYNNGGNVVDEVGQHIHELTQEAYDLRKFVKAFKRADNFANIDEASKLIEQARQRYQGIRETLRTLSRPKGYKSYTEQYKPITDDIEQADLEDIRSKLIRIESDNIVDTVLPSLARGMNKMKVDENNVQLAMDLAKDPSAKIELFPDPVDDQEIKDYVKHIKNNVIRNKKTSENPSDGIVAKILHSIVKRSVDDSLALGVDDMTQYMDKPANKKAAYQLAAKYLKGNVEMVQPKEKKKLKKEEDQYEDIMTNLSEGTWAIPDTAEAVNELESIMADVLPLGAEGENATGTMYGIIGDDELFDDLGEAGDKDPTADARPIISNWIKTNIENYDIDADLVSKIMAVNNKFNSSAQPTAEGAVKRAMETDAENMSKEEFMKKHGGPNADDEQASDFYDGYQGVEEADVEEGNEFIDARRQAIKNGDKEFTVGGKTFKVTGDTSDEKSQNEADTSDMFKGPHGKYSQTAQNKPVMFKGKQIDLDTVEYDMQDYSDMIFEPESGMKYTDGTEVADEDMEELMQNDDFVEWVRVDYMDKAMDRADMMRDSTELDIMKKNAGIQTEGGNAFDIAMGDAENIISQASGDKEAMDDLQRLHDEEDDSYAQSTIKDYMSRLEKEGLFRMQRDLAMQENKTPGHSHYDKESVDPILLRIKDLAGL